MERKYITYLLFISIMLVMTLGIFTNPYQVVSQRPKKDITAFLEFNNDSLYKEIQSFDKQNKIEPIDAKVDRVWKAIPGYNGLDVDFEASYEKMKLSGEFDIKQS
jgi:peptidoglycan-N-acetylglucosamine deacetylase